MNSLTYLFSSDFISSVGWTLLHSVWQAPIVLVFITLINKFIKTSSARYKTSLAGLASIIILSVSTFIYLQISTSPLRAHDTFGYKLTTSASAAIQNTLSNMSWLSTLQSNMNIVVMCWIAGAILFSLRIVGGSMYVSSLRKNAVILQNDWSIQVATLADRLHISRVITLAESTRVHAPIVLGYIKPVIIVPVGLFSGLYFEQIEMILIHELMHIKRHDYLVNILQMIMESVFFFNPFVWILSENIRKEREHCCDDAVVSYRPNAFAYATALAQLEEVRLNNIHLAMGLAQNKNQLLNRIKRLMENSVKNYSARERMVPALLLVVGLICASWLTISKGNSHESMMVSKDTSIHKKDKSSSYSRKSISITNEDGEPYEEIVESYDVENDEFPFIAGPDFELPEMPDIPDFSMIMPPVPPIPDYIYEYDTVPGTASYFSLHDFEKFSAEFEKNFTEQFGCKKKDQQDIDQVMKELAKLESDLHNESFLRMQADMQSAVAMQYQVQAQAMAEQAKQSEMHAKMAEKEFESLAKVEEEMKVMEKQLAHQMKALEANMKKMEANMKQFEKELQVELIKDGYIKSNEKISNIHWKKNGDIEINDKKIKDDHLDKYRALHDKYFDKEDSFEFQN